MSELLLGCGFSRKKLLGLPGQPLEWKELYTCDRNPKCNPHILCDLDLVNESREWCAMPYGDDVGRWDCLCLTKNRFKSSFFDEIHAYEVLEHLGTQGDVDSFFFCFENLHRILKPGGHLFATVPSRYSAWAWGDPSHRRIICAESLAFLSQEVIAKNRAQGTAMSDFSDLWDRDFKVLSAQDDHRNFIFCLQAIK